MKVLLHACCGPCAVYPVDALRAEGLEPSLFFFNPNIHPFREYRERLAAVETLAGKTGVRLIVEDRYQPEEWMEAVAFRRAQRCMICYRLRLERAAHAARRGRFDAFSTTILYSKTQKHDLCRHLAEAVAEEAGVPFLYRDFRVGWQAGIEASKAMGLYRQEYCGCLFSERDRFQGTPRQRKAGEGGK
jgi:hypothetical protein